MRDRRKGGRKGGKTEGRREINAGGLFALSPPTAGRKGRPSSVLRNNTHS